MPFPVVQSPLFFPLSIDKKEAAMSDDLFGEYGLGIHDNITGFPFDFSVDAGLDPIAVDPGLTLSPYGTTPPDSHFTTPNSVPLLSPGSSIEYFGDHRSSIGSIDSTVAPHEVSNRTAVGSSTHNTKRQSHQPTKTKPDTASTTATDTANSATDTTAAKANTAKANIDTDTNTNTMMTRTRKAAAQNADAAPAEAQPRAKRQKTAASTQTTKIKQEPQQQQQPLPPPKRKLARRGASAKREDTAQRTKNLERNRIAASKCRQKKKEWVMELEETKSGMEMRHTNLRLEYLTLLDEVTRIKNQLMAHAACNDPNINFWIEKEALRYVERCMDPPAAAASGSAAAAAAASASASERRPSTALTEPAAAESCTLPSPSESQPSNLESPVPKHESINLDYMPEELLSGDAV